MFLFFFFSTHAFHFIVQRTVISDCNPLCQASVQAFNCSGHRIKQSCYVIGFPLRNHTGHSLQKWGPGPTPAFLWLATKSWAGGPPVQCSLQVRWRAVCIPHDNIQLARNKAWHFISPTWFPFNWEYNLICLILLISEFSPLNATLLGSLSVSTCSIHCPTAWRVLWHISLAAPWQASSGWTHGSSEQLLHKKGTNTVTYNPDSYYETGQLIQHKKRVSCSI